MSVSMFILENWSKFPVLVFVSSFLSVFEISSTSVANTDDVSGSSFLTLQLFRRFVPAFRSFVPQVVFVFVPGGRNTHGTK